MHKNTYQKLSRSVISLVVVGAVLLIPAIVLAQVNSNFGLNSISTNLGQQSLVTTIGRIINIVLGFLGLVAFLIILYAGFLWMTSNGDEKKIDQAKRIMVDGVIGLAIILASWGIAAFVINRLAVGTGDGNNNTGGECVGCTTLPPGARYLMWTSRYPSNSDPVPQNILAVVNFNQNLKCEMVTNNSVQLFRGNTQVTNFHLRCSGRSITIRSAGPCPAPLNQYQVPANPNQCGAAPPISQCLARDATQTNPQCQAQTPPVNAVSQCPGLRGCGCFAPGSYRLVLKGGSTGDHLEGLRSFGHFMAQDESLGFAIGNGVETEAPKVASVAPDPNASNIVRNRHVVITFTKPIDPTTIKVYNANPDSNDTSQVSSVDDATILITSNGQPISGRIAGMTNTSVRWRPTTECGGDSPQACTCLPANAAIAVTVKDGISGIKGSSCLSLDTGSGPANVTCSANDNCHYNFNTNSDVDLTRPVLDTNSVYPVKDATDVDRALLFGSPPWPARVLSSFTDASGIAIDTVDRTSFMMTNDVPTASVDPLPLNPPQVSNLKFGLWPGTEVLAPNRAYRPTVYGGGPLCSDDEGWGIKDGAGNPLEKSFYWSFKTGDSVNGGGPFITKISPNAGPHGQCVTILGYNLGCFNGPLDIFGLGNARNGKWQGNGCATVAQAGKIEISGAGEIQDSSIISWSEVDRPEPCLQGNNCPSACTVSTCANSCGSCELVPNPQAGSCQCPLPENYSTRNQIILTIPPTAINSSPSTPGQVTVYPPFNP